MPHHIVSIEAPEIEAVDDDDEPIEESEEEYESDDEDIQEQMFCNTQFITQEKAQEIEEHLKEDLFIENEYFYQYKEVEKGMFHTGELDDIQQRTFKEFMDKHKNLFSWDSDDFG